MFDESEDLRSVEQPEADAAEFIAVALEAIKTALQDGLPALLQARQLDVPVDYLRAFSGVMANSPTVWVVPQETDFSDEGQAEDESHGVRVIIGVVGGSPEQLVDAALAYVRAAHRAICGATLSGGVKRIWIKRHDYGALRQIGDSFGVYPHLDLTVETTEVL